MNVVAAAPDYAYPSLVPLDSESHGGEDVAVYARGPWAHLFSGNYEQSQIPLTIAYSANIGPMAERNTSTSSTSAETTKSVTSTESAASTTEAPESSAAPCSPDKSIQRSVLFAVSLFYLIR